MQGRKAGLRFGAVVVIHFTSSLISTSTSPASSLQSPVRPARVGNSHDLEQVNLTQHYPIVALIRSHSLACSLYLPGFSDAGLYLLPLFHVQAELPAERRHLYAAFDGQAELPAERRHLYEKMCSLRQHSSEQHVLMPDDHKTHLLNLQGLSLPLHLSVPACKPPHQPFPIEVSHFDITSV